MCDTKLSRAISRVLHEHLDAQTVSGLLGTEESPGPLLIVLDAPSPHRINPLALWLVCGLMPIRAEHVPPWRWEDIEDGDTHDEGSGVSRTVAFALSLIGCRQVGVPHDIQRLVAGATFSSRPSRDGGPPLLRVTPSLFGMGANRPVLLSDLRSRAEKLGFTHLALEALFWVACRVGQERDTRYVVVTKPVHDKSGLEYFFCVGRDRKGDLYWTAIPMSTSNQRAWSFEGEDQIVFGREEPLLP